MTMTGWQMLTGSLGVGYVLLALQTAVAAPGPKQTAGAQVRESPMGERHLVPRAPATLKIDADLKEWELADTRITITEAVCSACGVVYPDGYTEQNAIRSDADSSARVALAWDDRHLYVAAHVRDDSLVGVTRDGQGKWTHPWACDTLMIRLHAIGQVLATGRYHQRRTSPLSFTSVPNFFLSYHASGSPPRELPRHCRYATRKTGDGWVVEAALRWACMGYDVRPGDRIRFALELKDQDEAKGSTGQMIWKHWYGFGAGPPHVPDHSRLWPELRLVTGAGCGVDLVPSANTVVVGQSVRFKSTADARAPGTELVGFALRDASGRVAGHLVCKRAIKPGTTLEVVGDIPTQGVLPGRYHLVATTTAPGRPTRAAEPVPVELVRSLAETPRPADAPAAWRLVENPCRYWNHAVGLRPSRGRVTLKNYLDFVDVPDQKERKRLLDYYRRLARTKGMVDPSRGFAYAALARATGRQDMRELALWTYRAFAKGVAQPKETFYRKRLYWSGEKQAHLVLGWHLLRKMGAVSDADETMYRQALLQVARKHAHNVPLEKQERGAFNRCQCHAFVLACAAKYWPNDPEAKTRWTPYARLAWQDWWPHRDTSENSAHYNSLWLRSIVGWAFIRDDTDRILADPRFRALCERILHQVAPCGVHPVFGDACGYNNGFQIIGMLEMLGALFQDGRYKFAARRILQRLTETMTEAAWKSNWRIKSEARMSVYLALAFADETLKERPIGTRSRVFHRKRMIALNTPERKRLKRFFLFRDDGDATVPDKLVLASGSAYQDLWGLVELTPYAGHAPPVAPAVVALIHQGSALLADQGYVDKKAAYHNVVLVEDLEGIAPTPTAETITVAELDERKELTYARVRIERYKSYPVTCVREFLLLKNRFLWVRDTVTFDQSFRVRVGPQWHTRQIAPAYGDHWANTYFDIMQERKGNFFGGRTGGRQCLWATNPSWDLLVYFLPRPGMHMDLTDHSRSNMWLPAPQRVRYVWSGLPSRGQCASFDSLLIPHKPLCDALTKFVEGVQVHVAAPRRAAVTVPYGVPKGTPHQYQHGHKKPYQETLHVVFQSKPGQVQAGPMVTDAAVAYLRVRDGKPAYLLARQATRVTYKGRTLHQSNQAQTVEREWPAR